MPSNWIAASLEIKGELASPMTTAFKNYPSRVEITFQGKDGNIALDQIRAIDKTRLVKYLGDISEDTQIATLETLQKMFK